MADDCKKLRIAFILGGGVSLGTFSSGALDQVIKDLERSVGSDKDKYESCELDVWSGASAGAVTLAMAVHELFSGRSPTDELHRLWVEALDIEDLYHDDIEKATNPALFSSTLLGRELSHLRNLPKTGKGHELLPNERPVALGFSLANLNGIEIEADLQEGFETRSNKRAIVDAASTTLFEDSQRFLLNADNNTEPSRNGLPVDVKSASDWQAIGKAARASGAFPVAFTPQQIRRGKEEYGYLWSLRTKAAWFAYADGGIFNNEPLKLAIEMAQYLDRKYPDPEAKRVYIVIDPNLSTGDNQDITFFSGDGLRRKGPEGVPSIIGRLLSVVLAQATFKDWLKAKRFNNELDWAHRFVEYLGKVINAIGGGHETNIDLDEFDQFIDSIIETKYEATSGRSPDDKTVKRLRKRQYERLEDEWGGNVSATHRDLFIRLVALFENAAGLRKKQKLALLGIAPGKDHTLAGRSVRGFGGFFQQEVRQHDFEVGQAVATEILHNSPLCTQQDTSVQMPQPVCGKYSELDSSVREKFEEYVAKFILAMGGVEGSRVRRRLLQRFGVNRIMESFTK